MTTVSLLAEIGAALGGVVAPVEVALTGEGSVDSVFAVSDLAQASVASAGMALASLVAVRGDRSAPRVSVDRSLAADWFVASLRPMGWSLPPVWDPVAGDYATSDGWIRLHTNAPHHRRAALAVLGVPAEREAVMVAVRDWSAGALEEAVVAAGGAAAALRTSDEWGRHPQGRAVASEPLIDHRPTSMAVAGGVVGSAGTERPLAGVRVLDLTRVLAGPVATRLLAGWGADVLRIDPPLWDEPALVAEMTLGKHCARLDLRASSDRDRFLSLLSAADVLVHGYRADALDALGLGTDVRAEVRPGLVDVSLDAYGWTGPWRNRRGFDSLVQMSTGIADAGRRAAGGDRPVPLPFQALDHATGYLMAASAITGLVDRHTRGRGSGWRLSLARTAALLVDADHQTGADGSPPVSAEPDGAIESTTWGEARRIPPPLVVEGAPLRWALPARPLGSDPPVWSD